MAKKAQSRNLPQVRMTFTREILAVLDEVAESIRRPGFNPNRSEANRKIIAEWKAGQQAKVEPEEPIRKRRKKNPE